MKNIDLEKIKKYWNGLFDHDRLEFEYKPWRDWRILVVVFLIGEVLIISANYFFYQNLNNRKDEILAGVNSAPNEIKERFELDKVYNQLVKKTENFEAIKNQKFDLVDPSK